MSKSLFSIIREEHHVVSVHVGENCNLFLQYQGTFLACTIFIEAKHCSEVWLHSLGEKIRFDEISDVSRICEWNKVNFFFVGLMDNSTFNEILFSMVFVMLKPKDAFLVMTTNIDFS